MAVRYLSAWLTGRGAVAIDGLMEDAATAEICRAQLWQWVRHRVPLDDGRTIDGELVATVLRETLTELRETLGEAGATAGRLDDAADVFTRVTLVDELPEFLTLVAYDQLER